MATLHDVADLTRGIVNDTEGSVYTDPILLPFIASAYRELQMELVRRGLGGNETYSDVAVTAVSGVTVTLPSDFIAPLRLLEKATGSTDKFASMTKVDVLPDIDQVDALQYWMWSGGAVKLVGATVAVTVRIFYVNFLAELTNSGSTILVPAAVNYLAWAAASLVARSRGEMKIVNSLAPTIMGYLDNILGAYTYADQFTDERREPYGGGWTGD